MTISVQGHLKKMDTQLVDEKAHYSLHLGGQEVLMHSLINQTIKLEFLGQINCTHCGKLTKSSYAQGYCYHCMQTLAACDTCIMSPERCHYDQGTCRDPAWGDAFCMQPHIVYLANSSGLKVGITRLNQIPTRWLDQGAIQGLPILKTASRKLAGEIECLFKKHVADKTNWRMLLQADAQPLDLAAQRDHLKQLATADLIQHLAQVSPHHYEWLNTPSVVIQYPIQNYPSQITSHNLSKHPVLEDRLIGIKGQYLMFDKKVINLRKYTSHLVRLTA